MRVVWRAGARGDLDRILDYLAERNPAAAARLIQALIVAADSLASFPDRGRQGRAPGTRELVTVYPYLLVYMVDRAAGVVRYPAGLAWRSRSLMQRSGACSWT